MYRQLFLIAFVFVPFYFVSESRGQDFRVVKVTYGDDNNREDVTDIFREKALLHKVFFYFDVGYREIGRDPAPGKNKHVLIDISLKNKETKTLRFHDGQPAYYTTLSPEEDFTILAAFWGGDGKFIDVRERVLRALVLQDGLDATGGNLGDPPSSRHRKLFVVYSRGKYIHVLRTGEGDCFTAEKILHDDFDIEAVERQLRKITRTTVVQRK
ncbi:MAG TPA: hypothetical protein DEB39_14745 [Planctomycetaceae bacterium]|nr:hypothetical protein [Planctomycetaceae bacterium]